MFNAKNLLKMI